jgi:hypothetical protein
MIDVTNSNATIESSASISQEDWTELMFLWTAPTGCRTAVPRFISVDNAENAFFDDYQVWANDGHIYPLPSWITRKEQVKDIVVYPQGTASIGSDSDYISNERRGQSVQWRFEREDYSALEEIRIWVPAIGMNRPYVVCERPVSEVSFDYGTAGTGTTANTIPVDSQTSDLLVAGILGEAFRELASRSSDGAYYEDQARYHTAIWQNGMQMLKPRERRIQSNRLMIRQ